MALMPWAKWLDTRVCSATAAESRAFVWSAQTGMIDIGTLGGAYAQAYAINDAGYITGASQTQGMGPMLTTHAFIYRLPTPPYPRFNRMVDLGVLGGFSSYGMAINSYNHVAGYSTISTKDDRVHAFLHDGKKMIDLGSLGGPGNRWGSDLSVALGVNNTTKLSGTLTYRWSAKCPFSKWRFSGAERRTAADKWLTLIRCSIGGEKTTCSSRRQELMTAGRSWPPRTICLPAQYALCC